ASPSTRVSATPLRSCAKREATRVRFALWQAYACGFSRVSFNGLWGGNSDWEIWEFHPRSLSGIDVRHQEKKARADVQLQVLKNRRRICWNPLRFVRGREQRRCLCIVRC